MTRRTARIGLVIVVVLLAMVVSSVLALSAIARRLIVWQLAAQTGRAVTLDAADVGLVDGRIALKNLRIVDRDGGPLATFERLEGRLRTRDLLRGHVRIVEGTLVAPTVRIVRTGPRQFNISDLAGPTDTGPSWLGVTIDRFVVRDGSVTIEDRTSTPARVWKVEGLSVEARDASTTAARPAGTVALTARVAGGSLELALRDVRLEPLALRGTLTGRDIDLGLAALALPSDGPLDVPRGFLDITVTLEEDAVAGSRLGFDLHARNVELRRSGQSRAFLTAPSLRLTGDDLRENAGKLAVKTLALAGSAVSLEDVRNGSVKRWQIDGLAAEAHGLSSGRDAAPGTATAHATIAGAEISAWAGDVRLAPLEARTIVIVRNVDLALARLYLPPDLPVQPERGVVNATVRVDHDAARSTRLGLDAGLRDVELRRPAHFVTAPAARVIAEDIALVNGTVTVARARLASERLTLEERTARPVRTWDVRDLAVEAKNLSSRRDVVQGVATMNARVGGAGKDSVAAVSAWVTNARLEPLEFHATTIVRNLDAGLLKLYLPPPTPLESATGTVNASIDIDHTTATGTRATVDGSLTGVALRARVATGALLVTFPSLRVAVADARLAGDALSIGRVELSGSGVVADPRTPVSRVDLASLQLATEELTWPVRSPARVKVSARFRERGELEASGTARLTAPLPTIAWETELALRFRGVDLAPLGEYVPLARGVGGRVRADITATVVYAGALTVRLRGDVGGGRFALAEGGRPLLALRRIDVTGLDVDWPTRVNVAEVRLREPFAHVERDRQGVLPLVARFALPPTTTSDAPASTDKPALPPITIGQLVVEGGRATIVDEMARTPARFELPRVDLTARDVTWPASGPARVVLDAQLPDRGTLHAEGTVSHPLNLDVVVTLKRAQLGALQPYFDFPAVVRARLDANLKVTGPLTPTAKVGVRGDVEVRRLSVADGARRVLALERLHVTGIDTAWPERITIDSARAERSWALIERDRRGTFTLQRAFTRRPSTTGAPTPAPAAQASGGTPASPPSTLPAIRVREVIFEQQGATIVDGVMTPPAQMEVAGARLVMRDFTWPPSGPVAVELTSPMPGSGNLALKGTVAFEPVRIEARTTLEGVAMEPAQPYLPIEGRVAGRVSGDLTLQLALDPVVVRATGDARLQGFRLNDGDRSLVAVGRLEAGGLDIDWPRRIAARTVLLRRPRLLVERDPNGDIILRRIATPRWETVSTPSPAPAGQTPPSRAPVRPVIEVATFTIERASARFVDQAVNPTYAEEVSDMQLVVTGFTTAPGRQVRFTGNGRLGGGSFKLAGTGVESQSTLDLNVELNDVVLPRANAYLEHFTGWKATRGSLNANASYTLNGLQLDAKHDVVVRGLEVVASATDRDEVKRRVGLPFGLLVSLLKDSRGEIKMAMPVSGNLGTGALDFKEAVWTAVRALALRLLASPFSRVGSLFVSQDSKVEAVAIGPIVFESGAARVGAGMETHLARVGGFLRATPAIKVELGAVFTQADVDALKSERVRKQLGNGDTVASAQRAFRERWPERESPPTLEAIVAALAAAEPSPTEALRALGARRLDFVRESLTRDGGVDGQRLAGRVPRSPLIEAGGQPRVEIGLNP